MGAEVNSPNLPSVARDLPLLSIQFCDRTTTDSLASIPHYPPERNAMP